VANLHFNLVDITKLPCYPHRRSTTVFLETFTPKVISQSVLSVAMQIQTAFCLINITLTSKRGSHVTVQSSLFFQINLIITSCAISWLDVLIDQSHSLKRRG